MRRTVTVAGGILVQPYTYSSRVRYGTEASIETRQRLSGAQLARSLSSACLPEELLVHSTALPRSPLENECVPPHRARCTVL